MAKSPKAPVATAPAVVTRYSVTAKGQNARCKEGTWEIAADKDGNKGSLAAIAALGATFTMAEMQAACAARNHKRFATYAVRRGWVAAVAE